MFMCYKCIKHSIRVSCALDTVSPTLRLCTSPPTRPLPQLVFVSGHFKASGRDPFLVAIVRPVSPPSILEIRMEGNMFVTHYSLDMRCIFFDGRWVGRPYTLTLYQLPETMYMYYSITASINFLLPNNAVWRYGLCELSIGWEFIWGF